MIDHFSNIAMKVCVDRPSHLEAKVFGCGCITENSSPAPRTIHKAKLVFNKGALSFKTAYPPRGEEIVQSIHKPDCTKSL